MYNKIIWEQGAPCELPEIFNPFHIQVWGAKDCLTLGILKEPKSYKNDESKEIITWVAKELLHFTLLEQNQDLTELTIKKYVDTSNWIIKQLTGHELDYSAIENHIVLTKIFQRIASKIRSDTLNRSQKNNSSNKAIIEQLKIAYRFITYLFPDDAQIISDHLDPGKITSPDSPPPIEFCVIESVLHAAKRVKLEEKKITSTISSLNKKTFLTEPEISLFFKSTKYYRNLFLYLFISITGVNGTTALLIILEDLDNKNFKKTSGKSISIYKKRANKIIFFEIPRDFLINFVNPFVIIFNTYNTICNKFSIDLKLDFIGRQIFREDKEYRHISQYTNFLSWLKYIKNDVIHHLKARAKEENIQNPVLKFPSPRDLRNYKSTKLEEKVGHNLAAVIMQHSTQTAFKHYYRRQESEAIENMGEFYANFEDIITNIGNKVKERLSSTPAGKCNATEDQKAIVQLNTSKSAYVIGDCTTPTGCLFCSFFVAHADEEGIFKLISMREYIHLKNEVVSYHSEIENNYGTVLDRIDKILEHLKIELKEKATHWIESAENKTPYGLHPIWQELYEMDIALWEETA